MGHDQSEDSPLDDLSNLSLPVSDTLLLGGNVLEVVLQLTILSRQSVHEGAQLERQLLLSMCGQSSR